MFAEILIKKLPLLIHVFAISLVAFLAKTRGFKLNFNFDMIAVTALTIFSTIGVLTTYAPGIVDGLYHGMGYGIGANMVGGGKETETCKDCTNPYSTEELKKTTERVTNTVKKNTPLGMLSPPSQPEEVNKDLPSGPGHTIIKKPDAVKVVKVSEPGSLCSVLEGAGYNPQWTYEDVQNMYKTTEGRGLLQKIDTSVRQQTGLTQLTVKELNECYPHFYQTYSCVKTGAKANPTPASRVNVGQDLELATSCHWPSLVSELNTDITAQFNRQMAAAEAESTKQKLLSTLQYLRNRSELEVRNLINMFQSKTRSEWTRYFMEGKTKEPKGYHIRGTTYYIPWTLLAKYTLCFGIDGNEK